MSNPISKEAIALLQPVIDRIDEELRKPQAERDTIKIQSSDTNKLKNYINNFKSNFRRSEWNGKFFIYRRSSAIHGNYIEVDFNPKKTGLHYLRIMDSKEIDETAKVALGKIIDEAEKVVGGTESLSAGIQVVMELSDLELMQHLMLEGPDSIKVSVKYLSRETISHLSDPVNHPTTAIINFLNKRGYGYRFIDDAFSVLHIKTNH